MGYDPIGITMKLWEYKNVGGNTLKDTNCCAIESINNAKLVCERLGVPHYTIDFTDDFTCFIDFSIIFFKYGLN